MGNESLWTTFWIQSTSCSWWDFISRHYLRPSFAVVAFRGSSLFWRSSHCHKRHKLRTEPQIASSNLKCIYIFKRMYFKYISFSFQRAWGWKESRVKALESFSRVCNKLILGISNSNFIKSKCQWNCNDSKATPSKSVGGLEMAQHPTVPNSKFSLPLKVVSAISVRNAF